MTCADTNLRAERQASQQVIDIASRDGARAGVEESITRQSVAHSAKRQ